jgi:hypothetical protein
VVLAIIVIPKIIININLKNNFIFPSLLRFNFTKNTNLNQKIITPFWTKAFAGGREGGSLMA